MDNVKRKMENGWRRAPALAAALVVAVALAAPSSAEAQAKRGFAAVPRQALEELKSTIGKPFTAGLVFVDGKFIPPPYKVERYGTAFRINGQQVTGQVISWDAFLKTQPGARIERIDAPGGAAAAPVAEPVAEPLPYDDMSDDFDDLFDDDPKPKKKKPAARAPAKKPSAPPPPATRVVFEGEFSPNARTKAMVAKLNKTRTDIEVLLRKGGACFFGSRYATVRADRAPAEMFLDAIPKVMKDSGRYEDFASAARSRGITFLPEGVLQDLFRNRLDYIKLQERARAVKDERKWESMLKNTAP
jgi:hypothetical protein